jgi:hypothetical protein
MRVIPLKSEIFVPELKEVGNLGIDPHLRKWSWLSSKLFSGSVEVIAVDVDITESVNKFVRAQPRNLRHHHQQKSIARDVKWHSKHEVSGPLVELKAQSAPRNVKLKKGMTRRRSDLREVPRIVRDHQMTPTVRICLKTGNNPRHLINGIPPRRLPPTPLLSIDGAKFS